MKKAPSPLISLLPIVVLVILLFATIRVFGSDALNGGSQISLLTTTAICILIGMAFYKIPWKDYELAITNNVAGVTTAIIILLIIGALSGIWMISGVVPTLIYYGMQIIHPSFFLTSTCIICVLISVMTGSSWTTIATIGIALMGIGKAQGFEEGWIAGAIISGAYFGDKVSPLSETTILAASVTDTPLFRHIRYMMITTVPSLIITLTIFTVAGLSHAHRGSGSCPERKVPYHPVAADYTDSNRHIDCTESAFHHYPVSVHSIGGHFRSDLPTGFVAGNFGGCRFQLRLPV